MVRTVMTKTRTGTPTGTAVRAVFFLLAAWAGAGSLRAESGDGTYYFPDLWKSFSSFEELDRAKKERAFTGDDLRMEAVFYFNYGLNGSTAGREKAELLGKCVGILEGLWKKDTKNDLLTALLGYGYTGMAAVSQNLDDIIKYVFKARNLFSIGIGRLPENVCLRLARAQININLSAANGRPDDLLVEDAKVYLANWNRLPDELKNNEFYRMGRSVMNLALAVVYADQGKNADAKPYIRDVVVSDFPESDASMIGLYKTYRDKLK